MGLLSNISGKKAVKMFDKFGYILDHHTGSHMILYHKSRQILSIPDHKELAPGLLRGLIRRAGLTVEEFLKKKQK
jgi:predicted RNA binding protein YcfA (HicA-like mRNA interferase family)